MLVLGVPPLYYATICGLPAGSAPLQGDLCGQGTAELRSHVAILGDSAHAPPHPKVFFRRHGKSFEDFILCHRFIENEE